MRYLLAVALGLSTPLGSAGAQGDAASRARLLTAAGEFREAASAWRQVLEVHPNDHSALAGLVDALEAAGDWRAAIQPLDRLLELGPVDPWRLRQRGLYAAWTGDLVRGVELLRRAVAQRPQDLGSLAVLAEVLSWSAASREEAARTYGAALARDSLNTSLLLGYADLLSWTPGTRDSAGVLYRRVLARFPNEPRARLGLANLLAWTGKAEQALAGYDSVLAERPAEVAALRGRGGALNQLGRYEKARRTLERARALAPQDVWVLGELARAELGSGRYPAARSRMQGGGRVEPVFRSVADSVLRATAHAAEVFGFLRGRRDRLDVSRVGGRITGALGSLKLYGEYVRSELADGAVFGADGYGGGARFDHRMVAVAVAGRVQSIQGLAPRQWDGLVSLGWRVADGVSLQAGATRSAVEETRRSVQGEFEGGALRGAVHANLAHLTLALENLPGPFDAEATLRAGRYTGLGLESNQRWAAEGRLGLLLHRSAPWVRIGYGFTASRFDYNADFDWAELASRRGGYFSPSAYWHHQGILQISQRLGSRGRWESDARLGREWVRQLGGDPPTSRNTVVGHSLLTLRLSSLLDLEAHFLYVNAFNAFRMKEASSILKVYFP